MKKAVAIAVFLSLLSFLTVFLYSDDSLTPGDRAINAVLKKTSSQLNKKYNLRTIGTGGSANREDKATMIGIEFQILQPLTLDECRKLIISVANALLNNINNEPSIEQYLVEFPFTYKKIDVGIFIHMQDNSSVFHPDIGVVSLGKGVIEYLTVDPVGSYKYKSVIEETYEEALRKLRKA